MCLCYEHVARDGSPESQDRSSEDGAEEEGSGQVWGIDLSGQLAGDISGLLDNINTEAGAASVIRVSCLNLIRVDFIAAGDLLNWVLARRAENREINFVDAHRLVALFFSAMGINEHALIKVRAN